MVEKADAGDTVGQTEVVIEFEDTALTLYKKICAKATELLDEVLPLLKAGKAPRIPMDLKKGSYFGGRKPEDGRIDWHWPAVRVYNLIRAVTDPYPGAYTHLPEGEKMFIWWGVPEKDGVSNNDMGAIEIEQMAVYAKASQGRIRLIDIEVGKKRMKDSAIFQYFKDREGAVLR
jgi:methionyl-tRNA formyltransferase